MKKLVFLSCLYFVSLTAKSQTLTKVDQAAKAVLYKTDKDFLAYHFVVKSDSVYKVFFDKSYISVNDFKKVRLSQTAISVSEEKQKLDNPELSKINVEFIEIVRLTANKYRVVFKYWQNNDVNVPHYYCLEVTSEHDPKTSAEFYSTATKVNAAYCGDQY